MKDIKDDKIFEILMTSEFSDGYRSDDFIFLLKKFRDFYRVLHSRTTHLTSDIESMRKEHRDSLNRLETEVYNLKIDNASLRNKIDLSPVKKKNKLLSFLGF